MRRAPDLPGLGLQRRQHPAEIEIPRLDQVGHRLGVHEVQRSALRSSNTWENHFGGDDCYRYWFFLPAVVVEEPNK